MTSWRIRKDGNTALNREVDGSSRLSCDVSCAVLVQIACYCIETIDRFWTKIPLITVMDGRSTTPNYCVENHFLNF